MYKMVRVRNSSQLLSTNRRHQICQQTGWGGQPIKASIHSNAEDPATRLQPVVDHRRLRITFNGSVSDIMPWKFTSQQREVRVLPGETALAFYTATNKSNEDIIGVATYSVTPAQVAPYFSKIQCFCFEEQRLNAGETVDMPVFFFIDPDFVNDPTMNKIDTITLSYTFFSKSRLATVQYKRHTDFASQKRATTRTETSTHTRWLDRYRAMILILRRKLSCVVCIGA